MARGRCHRSPTLKHFRYNLFYAGCIKIAEEPKLEYRSGPRRPEYRTQNRSAPFDLWVVSARDDTESHVQPLC